MLDWRRFWGLASRAVLVTAQRFLDCWSVYWGFSSRFFTSGSPSLLLYGLVATTILMAVTMQKHWSARKGGRAYGWPIGLSMAFLQVAPLCEMLDKLLAPSNTRDSFASARLPLLRQDSPSLSPSGTRQPRLSVTSSMRSHRSDMPKGSPGENAMRGVRKMSMVNLPQAMLSLWIHARQFVPVGDEELVQSGELLGVSFGVALLCVAFGIADVVLYIWVHDAFVRENKKLVTFHYIVEIVCRVPAVVLFHVGVGLQYNSWPTLALFTGDLLLTSLLLLVSRSSSSSLNAWNDVRDRCPIRGRSVMQFLYSLVVSVQLFVVNVVFFDPGMTFFYVNQAFYIIKYLELAIMLYYIENCFKTHIIVANPPSLLDTFWYTEVCTALINAFLVFYYVPSRRAEKDARMTLNTALPFGMADDSGDAASTPSLPSPDGDKGGRLLERLEETFEMLRLLSLSSCSRNRTSLLAVIVAELWLQVLDWNGEYEDGSGGIVHIGVVRPQCDVARVQRASSGKSCAPAALLGGMARLAGPKITLLAGGSDDGTQRHGFFDGQSVRWEDGGEWTKRGESGAGSNAVAVLRLILPQLSLALRWDMLEAPQEVGAAIVAPEAIPEPAAAGSGSRPTSPGGRGGPPAPSELPLQVRCDDAPGRFPVRPLLGACVSVARGGTEQHSACLRSHTGGC